MSRPLVTKGDVERAVKGAIAGGLQPGTFAVEIEGGRLRIVPCAPIAPTPPEEPNPWDAVKWD